MTPTAPDLFPGDVELAQAEAQGERTPALRAWLAWALRQREPERALALADEAEPALAPAEQPRLRLLRAEVALLGLDFGRAQALQREALDAFSAAGDEIGRADACWLAANIAADRGEFEAQRRCLGEAIACATAAGDEARRLFLQAVLGRADAFRDLAATRREWAARLPADSSGLPTYVAAAIEDLRGLLSGMSSEFLPSVRALVLAYELAQRSGQLRRAIALTSNLGRAYVGISDFDSAMSWLTRGLELARRARWPASVALCLAQLGETLRLLGRLGEAREALEECLRLLVAQPASRTTLLALKYLAHAEQDDGRSAEALRAFDALMARALEAGTKDLQTDAQLGRAEALLALGWPAQAREAAEAGLASAAGQTARVELLWVLGDIAQAELGAPAEALRYYRQALDAGYAVEAFVPPPKLLDACARAHAGLGDFERAYQFGLRAAELRQQHFNAESGQRALALHAASEAARYEALRDTHEVLLHLSEVGRELTAELEAERVLAVLERHVHALLSVDSMAVYVLDDSREQLHCSFGMEDGERFADPAIPLADPRSFFALSARENRELAFSGPQVLERAVPGTSDMLSVLFGPLRVAERVTGVMTVQAKRIDAYGERERLVFRSLCAYAAIGLENARAYQRLSDLQRQLMAQEKLAALGAMVAGVAHELNTPIGNSLLVANTLLSSTREFQQRIAGQALRRSDWQRFAEQTIEGLQVMERSMESAASLVRSFKQVAVDRSSENRRAFDLAEVCEQCGQTLGLALRRAGLTLRIEVPAGLRLDGYPGALGQVLLILLNNAMAHAFAPQQAGSITIAAQALAGGERIALSIADDGKGMSEAVLERIFEPFFTTRFGQGGSGLGLSICHNIVETLLGGTVRVTSEIGKGSRFTLELPQVAPAGA
ncbi:ATP-binding protein [Roseateles violae]|uniref:histidine kinase n=1 Tax=Roseateles violae TaxID=3058042 RepID=A0ABT8DR88_9BURK|nr:ATP-binding protein [Pelomonas sp. PFR6]MDN3918812.1 ATP-binding protein [Pelomonas sp. PFR6]